MKQYAAIDDVVYFWFGANDTSGSGGDGASPAADVRLAGAAAGAIPVYSPTPTLLSHANYPAGAYEIAITASVANGFATGNTYAVFCTLAIDSQNPTGFVGSFDLKPVESNPTQLAGVAQSLTDLKDFADNCFNTVSKKVNTNVQTILGNGTTPINLADLVDTGYNSTTHKIQGVVLADTVTALTGHTAQTGDSFARLGAPTGASIAADLVVIDNFVDELESRLTAIRAGYLDNLSAGAVALAATALTDVTWTDAKAAFLDHSIATMDAVADGIQSDLDNATDGLGALKALIDTIDGIVDNILLDTGTDGVLLSASATSAQLIDDNWDEILTGATHNIATSAGRRIREIGAYAIHGGTAQAGNSVHITLAATASAGDGIYNRNLIVIVDGTGVGQTRTIIDYNGTTKVALIDREWRVAPDVTSEYQVVPDDTPLVTDQGVAQGGTSTTITLRDYASSVSSIYLCNIVIIVAGTGRGQARLVGSYNGTTKVVTICGDNWTTTPDNTSVYVMIPYGASCVGCLTTNALSQVNTECDTALVDYDSPTRAEATTDKNAIITEVNANETKIDALNDITVADIITGISDGTNDLQEMQRIMFAAIVGKSSGGGTVTLKFRNSGDTKDRITATVDANGNRTAMTLDGS